jgi:hypothetical protein
MSLFSKLFNANTVPGTPSGSVSNQGECPFCSTAQRKIYHAGVCPNIKRIEYNPDGSVKAVEYRERRQ